MYENVAIITQIWHRAKCNFTNNAWYLITRLILNKITTFFAKISQQPLKIYEQNSHNYSNLAESQILFYKNQWPMVSDHGTQYEENQSSHHGGICEE